MGRIGRDFEHAAALAAEGGVVAFPTETVYGLGASARRPEAVARVFEIKRRPRDRALILHVGGVEAIDTWSKNAPDWARRLAANAWPGPLTLVLPRVESLSDVVTGGGATVGLRAPAHALALDFIAALGRLEGEVAGVAAPSANPHGATPPTTAQAVLAGLGTAVDYILDGGPCTVGIESTVVDACGEVPVVLREGALAIEEIRRRTGLEVHRASKPVDAPATLGTRAAIVAYEECTRIQPRAGDGVISRGPAGVAVPDGVRWTELAADTESYGRGLYAAVAALEAAGCGQIFVQRAPEGGLGSAINARIERAAAH